MDFGTKKSVNDRAKVAESRYGKTTGASKGYTPPPKVKIKPKIGKDKIGISFTQLLRGGRP